MNSLIPEASGRPGDDPIFSINAEANRRRAAGESVINASLGALMGDDGLLATMPVMFEALAAVDPRRAAAYAPIAGPPPFLDAVRRDALGDGPLFDRSVAVATPGGTGALFTAIVNFLEPGQALYVPHFYWAPYATLASHTGRAVETFPMFDAAGGIDVDAFERGLVLLLQRQGRALVILNFPCNNPTGYSLDDGEWRQMAAALERASAHGPVAVLADLAYAHFAEERYRWARALAPLSDRVTLLAAWTASKAFAQYGARVGSLVAVPKQPSERAAIENALTYSCRGTWSNCNHLGMLAITSVLVDPALRARADAERDALVTLLGARVVAFNTEARSLGLHYPRYEGGFFVSVFTPDPAHTVAECAREGVFVVPLDGAVRVALCSTPTADVPRLVAALGRGVAAAEAVAR
ncbi:MAG: aminotransferase class I/II-fold pyridoxal phosphate-dependent enzyme [Planctomycetota bacterium]